MTGVKDLEDKFDLWRLAWSGDDPNSITNQVFTLTWDAAVFGIINECRRTPVDGKPPSLNPVVQDFIGRSFVASQFARMRRLVDAGDLTPEGKSDRSVFSIRALLQDIKDHRGLMTRRNAFELEGAEYNWDVAQKRNWDYIFSQDSGEAFFIPPEFDASQTTDLHEHWDKLSGVSPSERAEDDIPRVQILDRLLAELDTVSPAVNWATIFVAHPASKSSRTGRENSVTFAALEEMAASIVRVCGAVSELFFRSHMTRWIAYPQQDVVRQLDMPWCDEQRLSELRHWWSEYEARVESWPDTNRFLKVEA